MYRTTLKIKHVTQVTEEKILGWWWHMVRPVKNGESKNKEKYVMMTNEGWSVSGR